MAYTISLLRLPDGRDARQILDELNSAYDPDAEPVPVILNADQRAAWRRVICRTTIEVGPGEPAEFRDGGMELWWRTPQVGLHYVGESAWIDSTYTLAAWQRAQTIARIVAQETGLVAIDEDGELVAGGESETTR